MHKLKIGIKEVQLQEAAILQKISTETFIETFGSANTAENMSKFLDENFSFSRITEELKDVHAKIFFATIRNEPVGYLKVNLQKEIVGNGQQNGMEISRIYVRKIFQGKNIGRMLFEKALSIAEEYCHIYIWLGVWENNPKAIRFYEKLGFKNAGSHLFKLGDDLQRDIIMKYMIEHEHRM